MNRTPEEANELVADNNKGVGHGVTASLSHVNLSANNPPPLLHHIAIIIVASNCCRSCLGACGKGYAQRVAKSGHVPLLFMDGGKILEAKIHSISNKHANLSRIHIPRRGSMFLGY